MVCPLCKCEAVITGQTLTYNGAEQKLYRKLKYCCRNKKCDKYEQEIGETKSEIPVETE